jgi:DNA-binding NarL/FixJ family response regulator
MDRPWWPAANVKEQNMPVAANTPRSKTISVGLLDTNSLLTEGLVALLERSGEFTSAGTWTDAGEAIKSLRRDQPDILLLDIKLPGRDSFDLLKSMATISPRTRTIVTVDCVDEECVMLNPLPYRAQGEALKVVSQPFSQNDDCLQLALKLGAHGVVHKQCSFSYLAQAIRTVHSGRYWLEMPTASRMAEQYLLTFKPAAAPAGAGPESLTLRERQVASLVAQGRSNKEIASELHLGYSTVKNYVSSILEKLDLRDRTQIALYAMEHGNLVTEE